MLRNLLRRRAELGFAWKSAAPSLSCNYSSESSDKGSTGEQKLLKFAKDGWRSAKKHVVNWRDGRVLEDEGYPWMDEEPEDPKHADVIIIGGGAVGCSIAYWLKQRLYEDLQVVVVERDPTYSKASTTLSVGGLRQQFSLEENIEMSLFGAEFLRNLNEHLCVDHDVRVDAQFHPYGYLTLATTDESAECLTRNSTLQNKLGAKNILLSPEKLSMLFPWLKTDDLSLGCLGLEKEGWFDPWLLLCALKRKAAYLGANFMHGEAVGMLNSRLPSAPVDLDDPECEKPAAVVVKKPNGQQVEIGFSIAVIAAGAFSGEVAKMAKIGTGEGIYGVALPVEPRKRYVYCVHCPDGPGLNTPLTIDPTGTYFRRDGLGGNYICGRSPPEEDLEPSVEDLSVDHDYFEENIWPVLANRVKAFENLRVRSAWAGYYEYNSLDRNGIIGQHPLYKNLLMATGFSGHGIQQAPAVGRAMAELIIDSKYTTIDLTRLGFQRIIERTPLYESNIV